MTIPTVEVCSDSVSISRFDLIWHMDGEGGGTTYEEYKRDLYKNVSNLFKGAEERGEGTDKPKF